MLLRMQLLRRSFKSINIHQYRLFSINQVPPPRTSVCPNDIEDFDYLSSNILPKIREFISKNSDDTIPILQSKSFDEIVGLLNINNNDNNILLPEEQLEFNKISEIIDSILNNSPRTGKSQFVDKLFSGTDGITQYASLLLSIINNNVHTYNSSQMLTVIENITIKNLCNVFYKTYNKPYGGIFVPGGSYSNMLALRIARDKYFPSLLENGFNHNNNIKTPILLTSDQSHYSIYTSVGTLGIGINNVIKLKTDDNGSININNFYKTMKELSLNQNIKPFAVNCNAGTTVLGAFDNFNEIYKICKEYDIWMHVDGCWGGAVAFCRNYNDNISDLVNGIEYADSIAFDSHKLLSIGLLNGCLLVKDEKYLYESCAPPNAKYLFHGNDNDSENYDIGLKTLQCGRTGDALKLYLSWLYYGRNGLSKRVENAVNNANYLCKLIKESNDFILIQEASFANICFWYINPNKMDLIKKWKHDGFNVTNNKDIINELNQTTNNIYHKLQQEGKTKVDIAPYKDLPYFFRMITANYRMSSADIDQILNNIRECAQRLT